MGIETLPPQTSESLLDLGVPTFQCLRFVQNNSNHWIPLNPHPPYCVLAANTRGDKPSRHYTLTIGPRSLAPVRRRTAASPATECVLPSRCRRPRNLLLRHHLAGAASHTCRRRDRPCVSFAHVARQHSHAMRQLHVASSWPVLRAAGKLAGEERGEEAV